MTKMKMMKHYYLSSGIFLIAIFASLSYHAYSLPAFPTAEGFGAVSMGGRGGRVIEVVNLNERGPGSLREAIEATGPRVVVFRVSGTIDLNDRDIQIRNPYITIAGQTAPGGGIATKNAALILRSHDVIIRHFRSRFGLQTRTRQEGDALSISPSGGLVPDNVIVDHCTFSWGWDSNIEVWGASKNLTIQWCIVSEAMKCSTTYNACKSQGILFGAGQTRATLHHNLLAHNRARNPMLKSGDNQWINNVVYNGPAANLKGEQPFCVDFIKNYYKQLTPHVNRNAKTVLLQDGFNNSAEVYAEGNIDTVHRPNNSLPEDDIFWRSGGVPHIQYAPSRRFPALLSETDAYQAYDDVLANAGARVPDLDSADARVINEVITGTGRWRTGPEDAGGYPDLGSATRPVNYDNDKDGMPNVWESARGLNPYDDSDGPEVSANGYTHLENYLNELAGDPTPGNPYEGVGVNLFDKKPTRWAAIKLPGRSVVTLTVDPGNE